MAGAPIIYDWTDEGVMRPLPYFAKQADRDFVVGEQYRLEVVLQRSSESHKHYFACIKEAFDNLPENQSGRWRSPEHLRKWALCHTAFRNTTTFLTESKAEAMRFAAFLTQLDEFAYVEIEGKAVHHHVAKSQSHRAMSKKEFQESKDLVLGVLASLIGIDTRELESNAGRAA